MIGLQLKTFEYFVFPRMNLILLLLYHTVVLLLMLIFHISAVFHAKTPAVEHNVLLNADLLFFESNLI